MSGRNAADAHLPQELLLHLYVMVAYWLSGEHGLRRRPEYLLRSARRQSQNDLRGRKAGHRWQQDETLHRILG